MTHSKPERITPYDSDHLPLEIELIKAFRQRNRALPQVACFDAAFHRTLPRVVTLLQISRSYKAARFRRHDFHGLSYEFLMDELEQLNAPAATNRRVILAHLGNGASLVAVRDGKRIGTCMGFTPTSGFMMCSRSGDMANHASGLLGVSELSSNLRHLPAREANDFRAAEAVALFCYQTKKWIDCFSAVSGGLDTLAFAGGIGEDAPLIRQQISEGLYFLGFELDFTRNAKNALLVSPDAYRVKARIIHTDEEIMIARSVIRLLDFDLIQED
jgi:acetate kinase